jgi:CzcA family heavy metal efflux pump
MWIVRLALAKPYTFIVLAVLILIASPVAIDRMPTDIFPDINIPVVAIDWTYTGLSPVEFEGRIVSLYERGLSTTVNDIEHIESQTLDGKSVVKVFFQPDVNINAAIAEVTALSQSVLSQMPKGITPPLIIRYNASTVPILQLSLSSDTLSEQELGDLGMNAIRSQLATVAGASVPWPYGGKNPQIMVDLNPALMQAHNVSPQNVLTALTTQNLILPAGTAKLGEFEYNVDMNGSPQTVAELSDLPLKATNGTTLYLHDIGSVRSGFAPQASIVRQDGKRGALLTVYKAGNASTLDIVKGVRNLLPIIAPALPKSLKITPLSDQSVFVRAAISGVIREALLAACLTGIMILVFLGSWRSTLIIAISIPLSVLSSLLTLAAFHETINTMTLGGLALAVGILVDDATVVIENVERYLEQGHSLHNAILEGASEISIPVLVSTLCICIVFLPMFFLSGVPRYLFVPLAESVVFAMIASYILSLTLVPTLAQYILKKHKDGEEVAQQEASFHPFRAFQKRFTQAFNWLREGYSALLATTMRARRVFLPGFLLFFLALLLLTPWLGQDFFPSVDSGQIKLHMRAPTGMRIEETAKLCDEIEAQIRQSIPPQELDGILDNIGLPISTINLTYNNAGPIGSEDADIMVNLRKSHKPTDQYIETLSRELHAKFPDVTFAFLPADMVSQILNFGMPAPIDVQVAGPNSEANRIFANNLLAQVEHVPGAADLRIEQAFNQPKLHFNVDRSRAAEGGYSQQDVATNLLISLSGSFQTTPTYWLNPKNGVSYNLVVQTPQYRIQNVNDLRNIPVTGSTAQSPAILADLATMQRTDEMGVVTHYNVQRVIDIYATARGRDLGGVGRDIQSIVDASKAKLPVGSRIFVRGQIQTMRSSYINLLGGLVFSIVLVYLLMVVNFQSWLDPFIIITALPAALGGIVLFLFLTHTTLSVPALMGAIMCMGVATANSILVVAFARDKLKETGNSATAALAAGATRFRPVLMTALAMVIGMVPMALGMGEGGEQNAPLGRAVIGGLIAATIATLFFVPGVFSLLHRNDHPAANSEAEA